MGLGKDPRAAIDWYRRAAEQGYAEAQYRLGWCHANGVGVELDLVTALRWYDAAAGAGSAEARAEAEVLRNGPAGRPSL